MKATPLLILALIIFGCSTPPRHAPVATSIAARNEPAAAAPAAAAALPGVNPDLVRQGYKVALRRGETVYCRKDLLTGSRFPTKVCLTEFQIRDLERRAHDDMRYSPSDCAGTGCMNK